MLNAFGSTRTSVRGSHALIAPDSHVVSQLPGWTKTDAVILISPQMGARFCMFFATMQRGGRSAPAAPGVERFAYVLEGGARVKEGRGTHALEPGAFVYLPPGSETAISATSNARLVVFEKPWCPPRDGSVPRFFTGHERNRKGEPFLGDSDARLKTLFPDDPAFDMAVNLFTFKPGTTLPFAETHVMEHGLLMVAGGGVYRLDDSWYPVQSGDVIWMAPYCPQWFVAAGKTPSAYLYYKDVQRDPLTMT